jgi:hypothetical protein
MKKIAFLIFAALISITFISCATTSCKFNQMRKICEKIEGKSEYTEDEYEEMHTRFVEIVNELESRNLNSEEQEELSQLKGRYAGAITAKATKNIWNVFGAFGDALKGFVEGVGNSFSK